VNSAVDSNFLGQVANLATNSDFSGPATPLEKLSFAFRVVGYTNVRLRSQDLPLPHPAWLMYPTAAFTKSKSSARFRFPTSPSARMLSKPPVKKLSPI